MIFSIQIKTNKFVHLVIFLAMVQFINLMHVTHIASLDRHYDPQQKNTPLWKIKLENKLINMEPNNNDVAHKIVTKSFLKTYIHLIKRCPPTVTHNDNSINMNLKDCMKNLYSDIDNAMPLPPWWFKTLLRDGTDYKTRTGLHGPWHYLFDNEISMCTIEKVSSTQWRKVFCKLNNSNKTKDVCRPDDNNDVVTKRKKFVFLRDPLERFLSAYIDKCINNIRNQSHCSPQIIFQNDDNSTNNNLLNGISNNKKYNFSSYVDVMPLHWNVHFLPQSLYCDGLYRDLFLGSNNNYDFVGTMNEYFYDDLHALGARYSNITSASNHHSNFMLLFRKYFKCHHHLLSI